MGILTKLFSAAGKQPAPSPPLSASPTPAARPVSEPQQTQQQQPLSPPQPSTPSGQESLEQRPPLRIVDSKHIRERLSYRKRKFNKGLISSLNSAIQRCMDPAGQCPRVQVCIDGACRDLLPPLAQPRFPTYGLVDK